MSGFRKAKAEQAALKIGFYGPQGSGKTFTCLLIAEGLAQRTRKRVAYIDTEHGTDFYCKAVPGRAVHPEAFDFDALYTKSLTEATAAIKALSPDEYSVVVIDSITHMWEAAKQAYSGRQTKIGTIPFQAWAQIKRPYKELVAYLLSSPMHVLICGRQGVEYENDEETEELKAVGYKMKAEGETPYEPHILIRMESVRPKKTSDVATIYAYAEKDRTGVLSGRTFANPTFDTLCLPILGLLGDHQAQVWSDDETAAYDAERLAELEKARQEQSALHLREFTARLTLTKNLADVKAIGKLITPQLKAAMVPADVAELRNAYQTREQELSRNGAAEPEAADGPKPTENGHTAVQKPVQAAAPKSKPALPKSKPALPKPKPTIPTDGPRPSAKWHTTYRASELPQDAATRYKTLVALCGRQIPGGEDPTDEDYLRAVNALPVYLEDIKAREDEGHGEPDGTLGLDVPTETPAAFTH